MTEQHYIQIDHISYTYTSEDKKTRALDKVDVAIQKGSHVTILGRNGSGKSTLARLINALDFPESGNIVVAALSAKDEKNLWSIRRICGMVFQNPDNQIIGTTLEEDIAFGPENLGLDPLEIRRRVDQCSKMVGLEDRLLDQPSLLSGGQKQRLAIAGVLALEPRIIILDESTSMLDPTSRKSFMQLVESLRKQYELTIINITHYMEEALLADHIYVMDEGSIVLQGEPKDIFSEVDQIRSMGLDVPPHLGIMNDVFQAYDVNLSLKDQVDEIKAIQTMETILSEPQKYALKPKYKKAKVTQDKPKSESVMIEVKNLSHQYMNMSASQTKAISDITFDVYEGEILGIMGHTGSGKSTLIQHLNGILRPQTGSVKVMGLSTASNQDIRKIRKQVGVLFQYPEHQLFAETVKADISYGPLRMGLTQDEIDANLPNILELTGLPEHVLTSSPFRLSGGQKRRVALAGILAMKPSVLVLDEPTVGLDPKGRDEILDYILKLKNQGLTVVCVSHSMEILAKISDRILLMEKGSVVRCDQKEVIFDKPELLEQYSMTLPASTDFLYQIHKEIKDLNWKAFSNEEAVNHLIEYIEMKKEANYEY